MIRVICRNPLRGFLSPQFGPNVINTASITSRSTRGGPLKLEKPFPYEEKRFKLYHRLFDNTMVRVCQENAKVIVVEGPIGVGKSACAKLLAEEFDMLYLPEPNMDAVYIFPSGYDIRQHDHELPISVQSFDHRNFCMNPTDFRTGRLQLNYLLLRFFQYVDALCHLMNTGQGVVLERSYYSDYVFMKAMHQNKFVSDGLYEAYQEVVKNTRTFLLEPHLIIYLDIPVPVVQERIRTRNYSYEQNSPALTPKYLKCLEKLWKEDYLKWASKKSEILVYNWTDGGNIDLIVEDIENIDFDILRHDRKFRDWLLPRKELYNRRQLYTNEKQDFFHYFDVDCWKYPELTVSHYDAAKLSALYGRFPETAYDYGYNPLLGDSKFKIMFKSNLEKHRDLRFHFILQGNPFIDDPK